jgi:Ca2+-binding EF-hand superfamily protein
MISDSDLKLTKAISRAKEAQNASKIHVAGNSLDCRGMSVEKLFSTINERISAKTGSFLGDYRSRKALEIFADGRRSLLDLESIKRLLAVKLDLIVPDSLLKTLFEVLDPTNTGYIKTRSLVVAVLNDGTSGEKALSLNLENRSGQTAQGSTVLHPFATFDGQFLHLSPPPDGGSLTRTHAYSVDDIEDAICEQVVQRTGKDSTLLKTLRTCFGDIRSSYGKNVGISRDQVKYSLWTRFQLPVSEDEIESLFVKYDPLRTGLIQFDSFANGIIQKHGASEALMQDNGTEVSLADDPNQDAR